MLIKSALKSLALVAASFTVINSAAAQQRLAVKSDDLRDVFMTAGYAAAFGAATGVALLPFLSGSVSSNMRVVAGGASIGFLLGSALSLYNISANLHATNNRGNNDNFAPNDDTVYGINEDPESVPMSSKPVSCEPTYGAIVVGCGSRLSMGLPDVQFTPQSVHVPIVNVRF
jgi:hypothetical protein